MKKILIALVLALVLALASPVPAADANTCTFGICGQVRHYSPDDGYDAAIIIRCDWSADTSLAGAHYVTEGSSSAVFCKDTDQIYMRTGDELWCKMVNPLNPTITMWAKRMDATGWHKIGSDWDDGYGCTLRKD